MNMEEHPDSRMAPVYVGMAAIESGDKRLAIESFQRAVRLNPVNQFAVDRLKELQKP